MCAPAFLKRPRKIRAIKQKAATELRRGDTFSASACLQPHYRIRPSDGCQICGLDSHAATAWDRMLGAEHLARHNLRVNRETLLRPPRRAAFGELTMMDSLPLTGKNRSCLPSDRRDRRLHEPDLGRSRGHDSSVDNRRILQGWYAGPGRPPTLNIYKNSLSATSHTPQG